MRRFHYLFAAFQLVLTLSAADIRPVIPANAARPVGPYTPGLLAGRFLYVSGQGIRGADGATPPTLEAQTRQCLDNVKAIVGAAGLTLEHVVYTQLYLTDVSQLAIVERVYGEYFTSPYPARATVIAKRLPTDTTIELNAVAVRDLKDKRIQDRGKPSEAKASLAVWAADRLYVSSLPGGNPMAAHDRVRKVLQKAKLAERNLVFSSVYSAGRLPGADTPVEATPSGAPYAMSAIASHDFIKTASSLQPCRATADAVFCSLRAADAGTRDIDAAARQVLDALKEAIQSHGARMEDTVAANVYVNDLADFGKMNAAYGSYFGPNPPARTTIQPLAPAAGAPLVRISLVVAR